MLGEKSCAFCDVDQIQDQIIRTGDFFISLISTPRWTEDHCLVVPKRHVTTLAELIPAEHAAMQQELGRLSVILDRGYGYGTMHKYQPRQAENGIKVNHLHHHVFPRLEDETRLFPVPEPNSFDGFYVPTDQEVADLIARTR